MEGCATGAGAAATARWIGARAADASLVEAAGATARGSATVGGASSDGWDLVMVSVTERETRGSAAVGVRGITLLAARPAGPSVSAECDHGTSPAGRAFGCTIWRDAAGACASLIGGEDGADGVRAAVRWSRGEASASLAS